MGGWIGGYGRSERRNAEKREGEGNELTAAMGRVLAIVLDISVSSFGLAGSAKGTTGFGVLVHVISFAWWFRRLRC